MARQGSCHRSGNSFFLHLTKTREGCHDAIKQWLLDNEVEKLRQSAGHAFVSIVARVSAIRTRHAAHAS